MTREMCKYGTCSREPGEQDRDDYNSRLYCSVQHEVKHDHIKADARDAREAELEQADEPEEYF